MINAGYISQAVPSLNIVSEPQIHEIKQAAFLILERTGVKLGHPVALGLVKAAGATVMGDRVLTPRYLIEDALAKAPKGFVVYDRLGHPAMDLSGRKSYYGTSTASPNQEEIGSRKITQSTLEGIGLGARLADGLDNIDFVMPFGTAQDAPPESAELFEMEEVMANTSKPIVFCGYSGRGVALVLEMAAAVVGGREELASRPFVIPYPEPITPLHYPFEVVERIFACSDFMVPQLTCGAQITGLTSPMTLAGSLALANAEGFFSIFLAQLRKKGSPCFIGASIGTSNLRNGLGHISCPELSLTLAVQADIGRSLGLPTWGLAGATDSKTVDAQAGIEASLELVLQTLAGVSLIHDCGYLDMGMACSYAMLAIDDEIISWIKRFLGGIEISADTLAAEIIHRVGPSGNFLSNKHTVRYARSESWQSALFSKEAYSSWVEAGRKTLEDRAHEKALKIIAEHRPEPLPEKVLGELVAIRKKGAKELAARKG
ncbi:MAG: trimethylamine methyltransferase family protein [Deltaproteobacteria bacterium]|jgi:trimethylamine--corrinoid protein Co-methyltransferase|nr:trimethylamine methyltransferase family protein [Deltaproteobacteria bacterium]